MSFYESPSPAITGLVKDWVLEGPGNAELITLGYVLDTDYGLDTTIWPPRGVHRSVAVFYMDGEGGQQGEYVVMLDDGDCQPVRSWTVTEDLVEQNPNGGSYIIPGFEPRDDVTIPYNPLVVVGGLGRAGMESCNVAGYVLRLRQENS